MDRMEPTALAPDEVAALLEAEGMAIAAELAALSDTVAGWHPAPGEWCVKETLGHLIEAERRGFNGRIRTLLAGDDPALAGWDQQAVATARGDCTRDVRVLLEEFTALRADSVSLVRGLREADLARGGEHPVVGRLRIGELLHEWMHHDRNHHRQVFANVQAYVFPAMGNAQRFSQP